MKTFFLSTVLGLSILSCSTSDEPNVPIEPIMEEASITTYNYLPTDFNLDWNINESNIATNQKYAFGDGGKITWEEGKNNVNIEVLNADTKQTILSDIKALTKDTKYIGFAYGSSAEPNLAIFEKDLTAPQDGMVRLRLFHALESTGAVDIYIGGETVDYKKVTNLSYKAISEYIEVSLQDMSGLVVYTQTGVMPNDETDIIRYSGNNSSEEDKTYTHVLAPDLNDFNNSKVYILTQ